MPFEASRHEPFARIADKHIRDAPGAKGRGDYEEFQIVEQVEAYVAGFVETERNVRFPNPIYIAFKDCRQTVIPRRK